jgi:hypothetical protein
MPARQQAPDVNNLLTFYRHPEFCGEFEEYGRLLPQTMPHPGLWFLF